MSRLPLMACAPSSLNATWVTAPVCPVSVHTCQPLPASELCQHNSCGKLRLWEPGTMLDISFRNCSKPSTAPPCNNPRPKTLWKHPYPPYNPRQKIEPHPQTTLRTPHSSKNTPNPRHNEDRTTPNTRHCRSTELGNGTRNLVGTYNHPQQVVLKFSRNPKPPRHHRRPPPSNILVQSCLKIEILKT